MSFLEKALPNLMLSEQPDHRKFLLVDVGVGPHPHSCSVPWSNIMTYRNPPSIPYTLEHSLAMAVVTVAAVRA